MKIHFCGAAGTTTGSQHLLEVNGRKILLDCGLYQGHRADEDPAGQQGAQEQPAAVADLPLPLAGAGSPRSLIHTKDLLSICCR